MSERYFKEVGIILRTFLLNKPHVQWHKYIQVAENVINYNYHSVTEYKPLEIMFGKKHVDKIYKVARFPDNFQNLDIADGNKINEEVFNRIFKYAEVHMKKSKKKKGRLKYNVGELVLIRNIIISDKSKKIKRKLMPKYKGKYLVFENKGKNYYVVKNLNDGKLITVNQSLMKPFRSY